MLIHANTMVGSEIASSDGSLGSVTDILFDDRSWMLRYLVADLGHWLPGRLVLLSFETITKIDESQGKLWVPLTRRAIELSPDVSTHNPISAEAELLLSKYWQWSTSSVRRLPRLLGQNIAYEAMLAEKQKAESEVESHLRSVREIEGYRIGAADGGIGHLKDLVMDDSTRQIEYLVVNAGSWLFQRRVLIPCISLESISWADRGLHVPLLRADIKNSPEYNPERPIAREYEQALHDHYRLQPYWQVGTPVAKPAATVEALRQESEERGVRGMGASENTR